MTVDAPRYYAYLFRMWRTGPQGPWRASLEDVDTGERIGFDSIAEAFAYLLEKDEAAAITAGRSQPMVETEVSGRGEDSGA